MDETGNKHHSLGFFIGEYIIAQTVNLLKSINSNPKAQKQHLEFLLVQISEEKEEK